jgi:fatty acid desaturase
VKRSKNIATVRTTVNSTVLLALASLANRAFGWSVDLADPTVVVVLGVVTPIFYRTSLWASAKWPALGFILFGKGSAPDYGHGG